MIDKEWDEAAAWINLKWDRMPLDPVVAKAWFPDLERFEYRDVATAINRMIATRQIRPMLPELIMEIKAVVAGKTPPLALPESRAKIPEAVSEMVDAILQRSHKQREILPELRVVGHDYRPSKPLQVERTEPLDPLQRWLARHYFAGMALTCAGCGKGLNVNDWYQVTSQDDLIHPACESLMVTPA